MNHEARMQSYEQRFQSDNAYGASANALEKIEKRFAGVVGLSFPPALFLGGLLLFVIAGLHSIAIWLERMHAILERLGAGDARHLATATLVSPPPVEPEKIPSRWYVLDGEHARGPFTNAELKEAARQGEVIPSTLIHDLQTSRVVTAMTIGGLFK